ncbi:MAG: hypothetical protein FJ149_01705 [Euryarchaeota archaeon]|nr:hypothetical protein [Euryarchaeota archaeon]
MTRQNEAVMQRLRGALDSPPAVRKLLVTMRAQSVTRMDLAVAKILISERKERGIYVTIDRPDKHVLTILSRHNVAGPGEASTEMEPAGKRLFIAKGIFSPAVFIGELLNRIRDPRSGPPLDAELRAMRFLLVDNLSSLAAYNGPKGIDACFGHVAMMLMQYPSMRFIALAGRDSLPALGPGATAFFNLGVEIPDEWLMD